MFEDAKTFTIQGHEFVLKPYTRKNSRNFQEKQTALIEEFANDDFTDKIFEYYERALQLVCDGPFDKIDWEEVDAHQMEDIILSFVPKSIRLYAQLSGF